MIPTRPPDRQQLPASLLGGLTELTRTHSVIVVISTYLIGCTLCAGYLGGRYSRRLRSVALRRIIVILGVVVLWRISS